MRAGSSITGIFSDGTLDRIARTHGSPSSSNGATERSLERFTFHVPTSRQGPAGPTSLMATSTLRNRMRGSDAAASSQPSDVTRADRSSRKATTHVACRSVPRSEPSQGGVVARSPWSTESRNDAADGCGVLPTTWPPDAGSA